MRKDIFSFAPDWAGAAAVFLRMGGVIVIIEAGETADKWIGTLHSSWQRDSSVISAILQVEFADLQVRTGQDEIFLDKVSRICWQMNGKFVALIGPKLPPGLGCNYKMLRRMMEANTGVPCLLVNVEGDAFYDIGAEKAWLELYKTFTRPSLGPTGPIQGVLGADAFDFYDVGCSMEDVEQASSVSRNLVIAPSALKAACYLAKRFGQAYEVGYPLEHIKGYEEFLIRIEAQTEKNKPRRILVCHQQILAQELRKCLHDLIRVPVVIANCFSMDKELQTPWDLPLVSKEQWISMAMEGDYDIIIGDEELKSWIPDYRGSYYILNHPAISGKPLEFIIDKQEEK